MRTILVLAGGSASDDAVFKTALDAAQAVGAHLEFLHVRIGPGEAAAHIPHVGHAIGAALTDAMDHLRTDAEARSAAALVRFEQLCKTHGIGPLDQPPGPHQVSAAWREEQGDALNRMIQAGRHHDLVVAGRPSGANGLPPDYLERLIMECGRPVLIAPTDARARLAGTVMVCWKEMSTAARALGATLPLLRHSSRVVIVGAEEKTGQTNEGIAELARMLAWHGIEAEADWMPRDGRSVADRLGAAAVRHDADLIVMGAYGNGRARELIFGGCTQSFLEFAHGRALLLMH